MEYQGYVSLWIGKIQNEDKLYNYTNISYTDDGDVQPSEFMNDFNINIDDYDEDFIERVVYDADVKFLNELIEGCSYEHKVIPMFNEIYDPGILNNINSAILLYNFKYDGNIRDIDNGIYTFRYIGNVTFE
jgi:hypothetical protein